MIAFLSFALLLGVAAFALITRGAWSKAGSASSPDDQLAGLRHQLEQLHELHRSGALTDEQFRQAGDKVRARITEYEGGARPRTATGSVPLHVPGPGRGLVAAIALFFVVIGAGGYLLVGAPASVAVAPGMAGSGTELAGARGGVTREQIVAMVDKLAERLKQQPDDPVGWGMLARAKMALGEPDAALGAYRKAIELRANDADLLADYADALAVSNGRKLEGEPAALIERALKADPNHVKALALAGTLAFNRKDYALTLKHWEKALQVAPADNPFRDDLRNSIAEVRQLASQAGLAASGANAAAAVAGPVAVAPSANANANAKPNAAPGAGSVSGTVTLAAALAAKADPQDTVYVFARPADGSRMPLAILKKQVRDLPLAFTLDDSLAMSPASKISAAGSVLVSARVSKSGNAAPQPGDLQGAVGPVPVGSEGVKLEISEALSK